MASDFAFFEKLGHGLNRKPLNNLTPRQIFPWFAFQTGTNFLRKCKIGEQIQSSILYSFEKMSENRTPFETGTTEEFFLDLIRKVKIPPFSARRIAREFRNVSIKSRD